MITLTSMSPLKRSDLLVKEPETTEFRRYYCACGVACSPIRRAGRIIKFKHYYHNKYGNVTKTTECTVTNCSKPRPATVHVMRGITTVVRVEKYNG